MTLTWLANTSQGYMVGDYISTSFSVGPAVPVIEVANPPSGGVFDEASYTVVGGLTPAAAAVAATDVAPAGASVKLTSSKITSR